MTDTRQDAVFTNQGPLKSNSLKNQAYEQIKDAILYRRLKTNIVYAQDDICQELGISRTPVREALIALQSEGYITFVRGRGFQVNELTKKEGMDIVELRREIDRWKLRMLETNLRLVINIAKHYQHKGLPFGDLIQEGNLGLMKALEKFDYKLGHRFCTYASWWVRQAVARALSAQSRVIRLPIHMLSTIRKMNIAEKNYIQLHGTEPTTEELAQVMELPRERVSAIKKMSLQCISLQAPQSADDPDFTIENLLSDKLSDDPMKSLARKMLKRRLTAAISQLSEREKLVLNMRYGLDGGPCKTLTEVSEIFNVTRERVRQLELKTLEKLRKHSDRGKYLEDFFL